MILLEIGAISGGSEIANMGNAGSASASSQNMIGNSNNIMNISNNNIDSGNTKASEMDSSANKVGQANGGTQVNQSSFTSVTVIEQKSEITINFGDTEKSMEQVFDLFSGKGEDEKLLELLLAIFEKQQEMIMELFQKLIEATGMASLSH